MRETLLSLSLLMFVSCGYDRFGQPEERPGDEPLLFNSRISTLAEFYAGGRSVIDRDIIVEGRVTANDFSGNFFRTFVIQDPTGALEINAGFYDLHNYYREGQRVVVSTGGLALGSYNGVLQLGRSVNPYSGYRVEDFGNMTLMEKYVVRDNAVDPLSPSAREINSLTAGDCGMLVTIGGLSADMQHAGLAWATPGDGTASPAEGIRVFTDGAGNAVAVVTSGYADFAGLAVPQGRVSLTGILIHGKFGGSHEGFAIKLRSIEDVVEE